MALPTSEIVVVENSDDVVRDVLTATPTGDTNHVLCRGRDEPLSDFGKRVEWRLRALRKKSSIQKVSYLLSSRSTHDWLDCRPALAVLIGLLSSGAEFELVASPRLEVNVVRTLEELMPFAEVGVRVSIRKERDGTIAGSDRRRSDGEGRRVWRQNAPGLGAIVSAAATASHEPVLQQLA
jgi:hypothetical protein